MSKFYETMQKLGYVSEDDRKRPGFESFKKTIDNFDIIIFFYYDKKIMRGYVVPRILFTCLKQVVALKEALELMNEDVNYLSNLSKYDIIKG